MRTLSCSLLLPLLPLLAISPASALDWSAEISATPQWQSANPESPYALAPVLPAKRSARQELALKLREGGLNAEAHLRWNAQTGETLEREAEFSQLYYDADLGADNAATLGRKVLSWGVGFGFKPLDVVQRENRRGFNPPAQTGIPLLAWQHFTADQALTLVLANPQRGEQGSDTVRDERQAPSVALNAYQLLGDTDLHGVVRLSARHKLEIGAGFAQTLGDEWTVHAAALYTRRNSREINALAESDDAVLAARNPLRPQEFSSGLASVAGATWTNPDGLGILLEVWHDPSAYRRADWRRLNALSARQLALTGMVPQAAINGNLAWSAAAFTQANLMQDNLLARLSYDVDQRWQTALECLYTPADQGRVLTATLAWKGDRQRWSVGWRELGGPADSAYGQSPVKRMAYFQWTLALP